MPFIIHKGLICDESGFFNAPFHGSFREGLTQSIHLADDKPEIFDIIHMWLYTGTLSVAYKEEDYDLNSTQCLDAHVLADRLGMLEACDAAIDIYSARI